ncbi:hypothetical protein GF376_02525 [Candidatus Peregrinibacteria bacterium]|nr:hypothetical protein [Candidatus Peregrinibacteria bacterium]
MSFASKLARTIVYALIIILPLLFWTDFHTIFTLPKLLFFRVSTAFILIIFLYLFFIGSRITINKSLLNWSLLAVSGAAIISAFFSINLFSSLLGQNGLFMGLLTTLNFVLFALIIGNLFDRASLKKVLIISLLTSFLVALYGLLQYFDFFGLISFEFAWSDQPQNRIFGTVGHGNHLGAYLATHLLIALLFLFQKNNKIQISLLILLILFLFYSIVLTGSRGAMVALIIAAIIIGSVFAIIAQKKKYLIFPVLILILLGSIFIVPGTRDLPIVERTVQSLEISEKGLIPERISFLRSAWQIFLDYPLMGTGISTFRDAFSKYRNTDYIIAGPGNAQYITVPESSHNIFADLLATQGLIGLIAWLFLIISFIGLTIQALKKSQNNQQRIIILSILSIFLIFIIQTQFSFADITNSFLFFLSIGLLIAYCSNNKAEITVNNWIKYPTVFVALIIVVFYLYQEVYLVARADLSYKQAKITEARNQFLESEAHYLDSIRNYPFEYSYYKDLADLSLKTAIVSQDSQVTQEYLEKAILNYDSALELNANYSSIYHNQALAHLYYFKATSDQNHAEKVHLSFQKSIQNSPNNPRYKYEYAKKLHSEFNQKEKAVNLLKEAIQINPDYQEPKDYLDFLYENHPELKSL